ncbi:MAG: tRNA preQ1(34) S-adenosylmethionine ribosyltransferase-isomerase QueA [Acidimicrobiia bacterium]
MALGEYSSGEYDYLLPKQAIAQQPSEPRDGARLLVCRGEQISTGWRVRDLPEILSPGDLLVFNATRTRRARVFVRRPTGGRTELLFLRRLVPGQRSKWDPPLITACFPEVSGKPGEEANRGLSQISQGVSGTRDENSGGAELQRWEVLAKPSRKLEVGMELTPEKAGGGCCYIRVEESKGEGHWEVTLICGEHPCGQFFKRHGQLPLPPYFVGTLESEERYQTVFGDREGSAASPTAGLHFTKELLARLENRKIRTAFVYLEIGADTLRPIRHPNVAANTVHSEACEVDDMTAHAVNETKKLGRKVVAVGTTVVRTLESFAASQGKVEAGRKLTNLFVAPGFRFQVVDALMTNFHAPNTSMLYMVAAMYPGWRDAYLTALREGFKFLSFGDAMLIYPK